MNRLSCLLRIFACGVFVLLSSQLIFAQFKAGIQGTITDTSGGLVPDAKLTLTNNETGKTQDATSSGEGFFRLSGLAPGKYKLVVEKSGYKQKILENISVSAEAVQG